MQTSISSLNIKEQVNWQAYDLVNFSARDELYVYLSDITNYQQHEFDKFMSVLSSDEIKRSDAFISIVSRKQFILSHFLLRTLIARYLSRDPAGLVFDLTITKKPFLKNSENLPAFNISHSGNKILIGISFIGEIGVDMEKKDRNFDFKSFAESHFSNHENQILNFEETEESVDNFFKIWTCKESWLKLTGQGLIDDLKSIDITELATDGKNHPVIYALEVDDYAIAVAMSHKNPIQFFLI